MTYTLLLYNRKFETHKDRLDQHKTPSDSFFWKICRFFLSVSEISCNFAAQIDNQKKKKQNEKDSVSNDCRRQHAGDELW